MILFALVTLALIFLPARRYKTIRKHSRRRRDYIVHYISGRKKFHKALMSKQRHINGITDATDLIIARKERGRVVGAFVYMNHELLKRNKRLIADGVITRSTTERQRYSKAFMRSYPDYVVNGGSKQRLYHATHLISFRHSLSEGDFDGLLFAGTAHLNSGARPDLNYAPPRGGTSDSTAGRVANLKDLFFANGCQTLRLKYPGVETGRNFGSRGAAQYSLNDFEILFDFFVNWKKHHVFKYGVECFYGDDPLSVHHVRVIIIDVTAGETLVDVQLLNCL